MRTNIILILLLAQIYLQAQSLLIVANPLSHNGYLTEKVAVSGLMCEVMQGELTNENSDFGIEVERMLPYWQPYFTEIKVIYWHSSLRTIPYDSLLQEINSYDNCLFLDHYSPKIVFGLPLIDSIETFESMINASNLAYLGLCNSCELVQKMNIISPSFCVESKYVGGNKYGTNRISILGF